MSTNISKEQALDDLDVLHTYALKQDHIKHNELMDACMKRAAETLNAQSKRIKTLEGALAFYKDGFYLEAKRSRTGVNLSEWKPTESLLNDCGQRALDALQEQLLGPIEQI